jgi:hypothetical protein
MRKTMNIETATLAALELLAKDRDMSLQDLVDEALADLLKKHRRPVTIKNMFEASLKSGSRRSRKS